MYILDKLHTCFRADSFSWCSIITAYVRVKWILSGHLDGLVFFIGHVSISISVQLFFSFAIDDSERKWPFSKLFILKCCGIVCLYK